MIYFDTFGPSGGVRRQTAVTVAGRSHVVDALAEAWPEAGERVNLTPGRFSWRRLGYERARRGEDRSGGELVDFLWRELHRKIPDASHRPILINYPQLLAPPRQAIPAALFIHDLNWRSFPENFPNPGLLDGWCRGWVERAALVFTNSEFTRQEILEAYGIEPTRVIAAPLAPFFSGTAEPAEDLRAGLAARGLVEGEFYFYPAVHGAHKGHDVLLKALSRARATFPVVVTCGLPRESLGGMAEKLQARVLGMEGDFERLIAQGRLVVLSQVGHEEMNRLRRGARALVLPSLYEGYGFPLAEAIALGKPVLLSDIPAYAEILARQGGEVPVCLYPARDDAALGHWLEADFAREAIFKKEPTGGRAGAWSWAETAGRILTATGKDGAGSRGWRQ
jgi:glycosyltransferase involved in cell wall biosynthesis